MKCKFKFELLPHWCITDFNPAFYDVESATAIGQTARLYKNMQELIETYNGWIDCVNTTITEYNKSVNMTLEEFEKEMNEAIDYMKDNIGNALASLIEEMRENGELTPIIMEAIGQFETKLTESENRLKADISNLEKDITKLDKRIDNLYIDNIETMKSSSTLKDGDIVKTLGYYNVNDGGSGLYKIRAKQDSDIEDNGSIHFIGENLVAELIIDNKVDVKLFGAKGDGVTDDTQAIKKLYAFIDNKIGTNYFNTKSYVALLSSGKYLVSEQIKIPIYIKTKVNGQVLILSNVAEGSTIYYTSGNKDIADAQNLRVIRNSSFKDGTVISSDNGILCIQRNNVDEDINNDSNSIGLEIGDTAADSNKLPIALCEFSNITISGFKKGLQINLANTYILKFTNVHTEDDRTGVYFPQHIINAGENISFNNCTFSHHYNAIVVDTEYLTGVNFNECSFDFNGNHVLLNERGNVLFNFNSCHFEGVGFNEGVFDCNAENTIGFGYITYRNSDNIYTCPSFVLNDCFIHLNSFNPANHLFGAKPTSNGVKCCDVKLLNHMMSFHPDKLNFDNRFMADENVNFKYTHVNYESKILAYAGSSDDDYGKFNHIPNDLSGNFVETSFKTTLNNLGYSIGANTWSSKPVNLTIDTSDKVFKKSIVIDQQAQNTYTSLIKDVYNLNGKYLIAIGYLKKNIINLTTSPSFSDIYGQLQFDFYDRKGNKLSTHGYTDHNKNFSKNDWKCVGSYIRIPKNADMCRVYITGIMKDGGGNQLTYTGSMKFGGIITEVID